MTQPPTMIPVTEKVLNAFNLALAYAQGTANEKDFRTLRDAVHALVEVDEEIYQAEGILLDFHSHVTEATTDPRRSEIQAECTERRLHLRVLGDRRAALLASLTATSAEPGKEPAS